MKRLHDPMLTALASALRSLERSAGKPRARKRARRCFASTIAALKWQMEQRFPLLDPESKEPIVKSRRRTPKCPVCDIYFKNWLAVAKHLREDHNWDIDRCLCGKRCLLWKNLAAHLAHQKDLKTHVTLGMIGQTAAVGGGSL